MAFSPGDSMTISQAGVPCGQVVAITQPNPSAQVIDTTALDSTWRTRIPTIPDPGQIKFRIQYDASTATHATITTALGAKTVETWLVTHADAGAATWSVSGFVINFEPQEQTIDTIQLVDVTIQCTSTITITP